MDVAGGRYIEVQTDALRHNYRLIRQVVGDSFICAVVKANGYGTGAVEAARVFTEEGALMLGVASVPEGIELREAGIRTPILLISPFLEDDASLVARYQLTPSIVRTSQLYALKPHLERPLPVHLEVETGMGRTGVSREELEELLPELVRLKEQFPLEGVFSHLSCATNHRYTRKQVQRFEEVLESIRQEGLNPVYRHLANSIATLERPTTHYDMVRVGTVLYGQLPAGARNRLPLQNPWKVVARVISVSQVKKGSGIGYGMDAVAREDMRIAVIPLGWADGLDLTPIRRSRVLRSLLREAAVRFVKRLMGRPGSGVTIKGRFYPYVGRSGMQLSAIRVDQEVQVGDEALADLRRLTADARLPRVYMEGNRLLGITGPGVF